MPAVAVETSRMVAPAAHVCLDSTRPPKEILVDLVSNFYSTNQCAFFYPGELSSKSDELQLTQDGGGVDHPIAQGGEA